MVKASELAEKEIINIVDGSKLGEVTDLQIDCSTGQICSLIVGKSRKTACLFRNKQKMVVEWSNIRTMGIDAVLVEIGREYADK